MTLHRAVVQGLDVDEVTPIGVTTAIDYRHGLAVIAQRDGVFRESATSASMTGSGAEMKATIAAFRAAYTSSLGGAYIVTEDGEGAGTTLEFAPGDTSNARKDVVYLWQRDVQIDDTQLTSPVAYGIAQGTPAGSPARPAVPNGAMALWEALVPEDATLGNQIVWTPIFEWTSPVGAPLPVRTQATLPAAGVVGRRANVLNIPGAYFEDSGAAWVMRGVPDFASSSARNAAITSPTAGMIVRLLDSGSEYRYSGSTWDLWNAPMSTYSITMTGTGGNPTLGSGATNTGRYMVHDGIVEVWGVVKFGSGLSVGSGLYRWSLPIAMTQLTALEHTIGSATALDAGTARFAGVVVPSTTSTLAMFFPVEAAPTSPISSLAAGDSFAFHVSYPVT